MNIPHENCPIYKLVVEKLKPAHGIDANHRCNVGTCKYSTLSVHLKTMGLVKLFVCNRSLQYHMCGKNVCKHAVIQCKNGSRVCPISAQEIHGPDEVYYPGRAKGRGSWKQPFSHCMAPEKSTKKPKSTPVHNSTTKALVHLLISDEAAELRQKSRRRCAGYAGAAVAPFSSFLQQMAAARAAYPRLRRRNRERSMKAISKLAPVLHAYIMHIKPLLQHCKGHNALVAACVGFLSKGLRHNNVVIFPKLHWVAELAPADTDYGKLSGFQSRPLSVAARTIKNCATSVAGTPNIQFVFNYTI